MAVKDKAASLQALKLVNDTLDANKISKPTDAPTVGQTLKVLSVNADGTFVCGWADSASGGISGVKVAGTELTHDADGKVNVPTASDSDAGVIKANSTFGIGATGQSILYARSYTKEQYDSKDNYCFISKGTLENAKNGLVTAALTDSNHISLSEAQMDTATAVIGAEREPKWELIRTIDGDGATKTYEVNDELISLYYAVYANANVSAPVITVQSYIGTVRDGTTRVLFHYISASNQTYLRKATGRCIKHGNMYTCELSSYVSNTNSTQIQRMHYGNIDDIITDDNIHYTQFGSSSPLPVGITIKVFGIRA